HLAVAVLEGQDAIAKRGGLGRAHVALGGHVDARGQALEPLGLDGLGILTALHDANTPSYIVLGGYSHVFLGDGQDIIVETGHGSGDHSCAVVSLSSSTMSSSSPVRERSRKNLMAATMRSK